MLILLLISEAVLLRIGAACIVKMLIMPSLTNKAFKRLTIVNCNIRDFLIFPFSA